MGAGEARRERWSEFRSALEAEGFRPSKTLGQNMLLDGNMARSIARDAGVGAGDFVLEVGPGCGFLSVHLAELGVELLAVEIDARLLAVARRFLAPFPRVRLVHADALATKHALAPEILAALPRERPWHLVANLPYKIAAPLLLVAARHDAPPESATVLVQREVAERIAARPGTRAWGALSAKLAVRYQRRLGRRVGAQLFWPRPRVESAVAHLLRDPAAEPPPPGFDRLVDRLFQARRKRIVGPLQVLLGGAEAARRALGAAGIDPDRRAEDLAPDELAALARASGGAGSDGFSP